MLLLFHEGYYKLLMDHKCGNGKLSLNTLPDSVIIWFKYSLNKAKCHEQTSKYY